MGIQALSDVVEEKRTVKPASTCKRGIHAEASDWMQTVRHETHLAHILDECKDDAEARKRFVRIAAIALAGIEQIDSKVAA
jgi:hypothetical protein